MSGTLVQLVAKGDEDIYLTDDPQITLFKTVYRRHVKFSIEEIPQKFKTRLGFGNMASCTIGKNGDLVHRVHLIIKFPAIPNFTNNDGSLDDITTFAWVRKLGFAMIERVELEIGGEIIDTHFTDWFNIFAEINGYTIYPDYNKMIGDYPELYNFTNGKEPFQLFIPIEFPIFRFIGLAFPIIATHYTDVNIHVKLNDFDSCHIINPSHYIQMTDPIVNFKRFEYIEQNVLGHNICGIFNYFDPITRRMYYLKLSHFNISEIISGLQTDSFYITGQTTGYKALPSTQPPKAYSQYYKPLTPNFNDAFLLVNYIFLDKDERARFLKGSFEYLIEKTMKTDFVTITSGNALPRVNLYNPCKYISWVVQQSFINDSKDYFNYTDSYKYDTKGKQIGNDIVNNETILFNSNERISNRDVKYFTCMEPYNYFKLSSNGIHIWSASLNPLMLQPSGSCNMSRIQDVNIQMQMKSSIQINNIEYLNFKCYGVCDEILRIDNGLAGVIFKE